MANVFEDFPRIQWTTSVNDFIPKGTEQFERCILDVEFRNRF